MKTIDLTFLLCLVFPFGLKAQEPAGIRFEQGLNWAQVQAKAKAANKLVFVDCFATWCEPCKAMDRDVYTDPEVGKLINEHFVSVKVQMDTTKTDDAYIQGWHRWRTELEQAPVGHYKVTAYPTLLYFSADGHLLSAQIGFQTPKNLLAFVADHVVNPAGQYYAQLELYRIQKDYTVVPGIINQIKSFEGKEAADAAAFDYIDHYLSQQPDQVISTKRNIEFAREYLITAESDPALSSTGRIFKVLFKQVKGPADRDENWDAARNFVDGLITRDEIDAKLWHGSGRAKKPLAEKPDWDALSKLIADKFSPACAGRNIAYAQYHWYDSHKDYPAAIKAWVEFMAMDGVRIKGGTYDEFYINNHAFDLVFAHSSDRGMLERTIELMREVVAATPTSSGVNWCEYVDTLANLLYKAGRVQEAIKQEKKAIEQARNFAAVHPDQGTEARWEGHVKKFEDNLEKMQKGLPTWNTTGI